MCVYVCVKKLFLVYFNIVIKLLSPKVLENRNNVKYY